MNFFNFRTNDESPSWSCVCKYDSYIDFLIWILEIDGLQTSTYHQHSDGDHSLRSQGLTMESWELWLTEYVQSRYYTHPSLLNNPVALKHQQDFNASFYDRIREMGRMENVNPNIVEENIRKHQQKRATVTQTILEESTRFYSDKPMMPIGSIPVPSQAEPSLIERIHELWAMFRNDIFIQRGNQWNWLLHSGSPNDIHMQLKPYHSQLRTFIMYFISYPHTTRYLESPVTGLISLSAESRTRQIFYDQAKQAASELVELNRSI
jgi:hypothetical protein